MNDGKTATPKSRPQYLMVDDSIARYENIVDDLARLVDNLKGGDSDKCDDCDTVELSFMDVLNGSSDKILNQNDRLGKLIAELRIMLF